MQESWLKHVRFAVILVAAALAASTGGAAAQGDRVVSQRPFARDSGWNDIYSQGALLFADNCSGCHGEERRGDFGLPLNLQSFLIIADTGYLLRSMKFGRPVRGMPEFGEFLTLPEMQAIATFVKSWQFQPSLELPAEPRTMA